LDQLPPTIVPALLIVFGLAVVVLSLHPLYFEVLPRRAAGKYGDAAPEWLRRYLERVVATPSLLGRRMKLVPHLLLVNVHLPKCRYAEAAHHCRAALELLSVMSPGHYHGWLEAATRQQLAECLEGLERHDEAAEQLRLAAAGVARSHDSARRYLTEGNLLQQRDRNDESHAAYRKALELTPASDTAGRIECMMHLVLSAERVGRIAECLSWAEQVIALGAEGVTLRDAHRMAGVALAYLGRPEESEGYYRRAYDLAVAAGDTPAAADTLGNLADCLFKRGQLAEAYEAAARAAALHPKGLRMSLIVQSQALKEWGRFEESLALSERYSEGVPLHIPSLERRLLAYLALGASCVEAECGRADDAWRRLQEPLAELGDDAKLGLQAEGAACFILAARGLADESRSAAVRIEARLGDFEGDPATRRTCLYCLARAACTRGDHLAGIDSWTRYLDLGPAPVYYPTAFYFRGECHHQLGQPADARKDYRAAVATDLDTYHARLARRQLGEVTIL
jgi:tetratricopeptide (TPR) repeat protein